jgi:hypothetical protein
MSKHIPTQAELDELEAIMLLAYDSNNKTETTRRFEALKLTWPNILISKEFGQLAMKHADGILGRIK